MCHIALDTCARCIPFPSAYNLDSWLPLSHSIDLSIDLFFFYTGDEELSLKMHHLVVLCIYFCETYVLARSVAVSQVIS